MRKRNTDELEQEAKAKKGKPVLINNVDEMEECGLTSSFGGTNEKQLHLESVRVETERSREERKRTQHLIRMLEGLITSATTPEEKNEYKTELVCLMR